MKRVIFLLAACFLSTLFCGLVYVTVQQNYRQNADDPQIQMAEDIANTLSGGQRPPSHNPIGQTDIAKTLSPFIIIYDGSENVLYATGQLDGTPPVPPKGVFTYTKVHGQDRLTWQPKNGVRIATVITKYSGAESGFVLVGRSLREVEKREHQLTLYVGVVWLVSLVVIFLSSLLLNTAKKKK